ncbi:hypothetical protein ZIOFF_029482 [Zingiber officinale]|uniref:Protein kinase domain-containing protein n=1 Tax=Zingiber officinale TaxID=94328 RepID=A0A8J5H1C1_ZINOF|nr:hypothetical protein ZIOFF_029482 [Zingiber officinale]
MSDLTDCQRNGWQFLLGSCMIRYEVYPFFSPDYSAAPRLPPAGGGGSSQGSKNLKLEDFDTGDVSLMSLIDLHIIQLATSNFSNENKLGEGGFGPVYKGVLHDGKEIAVRRMS